MCVFLRVYVWWCECGVGLVEGIVALQNCDSHVCTLEILLTTEIAAHCVCVCRKPGFKSTVQLNQSKHIL